MFKADNKVYLNSKDINSIKSSKKFDYKYYGLFKVEISIEI